MGIFDATRAGMMMGSNNGYNSYNKYIQFDEYVKMVIDDNYFVDRLPLDDDIKELLAKSDFLRSRNNYKYLWFADGIVDLSDPSRFEWSVEKYKEYGYKIETIESLPIFIFNCMKTARMLQEQRTNYNVKIDNTMRLEEELHCLSEIIDQLREIRNSVYEKFGKKYNISPKKIANMILKSDKNFGFDLGKNVRSINLKKIEIGSLGITAGIFAIGLVWTLLGNRKEKNILKGREDARKIFENCLTKISNNFNKKIELYIKENNFMNDKEKELITLKGKCYYVLSLLNLEIQTVNNLCKEE